MEEVLKIGRILINTETFCTKYKGKLYCVDVCEDAEERIAWLYNSAYGVKQLIYGEEVSGDRDDFLNTVFSSLPFDMDQYAEMYEDE